MFQHNVATGTAGLIAAGTSGLYAAVYDEWGMVIGGSAVGTLAFLWSIKGMGEDKRYKALVKRLDDSEADIEAARKDRLTMSEFYSTQIDEIKAKYRNQIEELEQAKLKILLELQESHAIAQRQIASDASVARTLVAVEAAAARSAATPVSPTAPTIGAAGTAGDPIHMKISAETPVPHEDHP